MRVRFTAHTHSVGERYGVLFGGGGEGGGRGGGWEGSGVGGGGGISASGLWFV